MMKISKRLYPLGFKKDCFELIKIAIPVIFSCIISMLMTMSALFFCGHLGEQELAAAALGNMVFHIFANAPIFGFASALDTLFPQIYGGEDKKKLGIILQKSIIISIITSLTSSAIFLNAKYALVYFIADHHIINLVDGYLVSFIPGIFMLSISQQLMKFVQSQNFVIPIMFLNFGIILLNVGLQYTLIFQLNMGINGATIAISISAFLLNLLIILIIRVKKLYIETWPGWSFECFQDWRIYLRLAVPGFLMIILEWSAWELSTLAAGTLGTFILDCLSIVQQSTFIAYQFSIGLDVAGNIYIGHLVGANKPKEAVNASKVYLTLTTLVACLNGFLIFILSDYLPYIFTNDSALVEACSKLLKAAAFLAILDESYGALCGLIKTLGAQFYGSIFSIIGFYVIALPVGISLMLKTSLRIYGWFIGLALCITFIIISQIILIFRTDWAEVSQKAYDLAKIEENPGEKIFSQKGEKIENIKITILKKLFILVIFIAAFAASLDMNLVYQIEENSMNFTNTNLSNNSVILS